MKHALATPGEAARKIRHWCSYQERSQHETRQKLKTYALTDDAAEELIASLIQENFLNEERFAIALAGGKFRMKKWGKHKISHALREKRVSEYCIKKALSEIDDNAYFDCLKILLEKKDTTLSGLSKPLRASAMLRLGMAKGFEQELIIKAIDEIL